MRPLIEYFIGSCAICLAVGAASNLAYATPGKSAPKKNAEPQMDSKASLNAKASSEAASQNSKNPMDSKIFDSKGMQNLPTNISSDSLVLQNKDRVFIYSGNVKVTQGDMTLTSKTLEGLYSEKNEIQRMIAKGDVVITKLETKATGGKALFEAANNTVLLTESPQVEQNGSILTADRIRVFLDEDRSQAEGNVRVTLVKKEDGDSNATVIVKPTPTVSSTPGAQAASKLEPSPAAKPTKKMK